MPSRLIRYRTSLILATLLFDSFLLLDYVYLHQNFGISLLLRLGVNTPLALLFIFAAPRVGHRLREFIFAAFYMPPVASLLYIYNLDLRWISCAQAATIITLMYANIVVHPRFRYACAIMFLAVLGDIIYLTTNPIFDASRIALHTSLLCTAAFLSLLATYQTERHIRTNYLLRLRGEKQNAELASVNAKLARLSTIDFLTGIPNRRAFEAELHAAWELNLHKKQPLAALMIDVDHFKEINDKHGHAYGDTVLREAAHSFREALRGEHDIIARYGGDEFIVLLSNCSLDSALSIAERLCASIRAIHLPTEGNSMGPCFTASIGAASVVPTRTIWSTDLPRIADAALYEAKNLGRNRVWAAVSKDSSSHSEVQDSVQQSHAEQHIFCVKQQNPCTIGTGSCAQDQ